MSEPKAPIKFKFVGGPSRKRRRHVPISNQVNSLLSQSQFRVARAGATTGVQARRTSPSPVHVVLDRLPISQATHSEIAATVAPKRDGSARTIAPGQITTTETSSVIETELPSTSDSLMPFVDWLPPSELSTNANSVHCGILLNNPFPSISLPLYPISPVSGLYHGISSDGHEEYHPAEQPASLPQNMLTIDSSLSIEDMTEEARLNSYYTPVPSTISNKIDGLFIQYDREFCVWPLTHDFEANPFRYDKGNGRSSPLLWHSILALSYKHIHHETGSCLDKALDHKKKAIRHFEKLQENLEFVKARSSLLDGLLILMTLDCATSAQGPWVAHLRRARKLIEAVKGTQRTPRIQAQVDMLVWWDVTLGLSTRQGFVLSKAMFNSVIQSDRDSAFYNISGCPAELFKYMFWLGIYAREFELASHMTCVSFDMFPVLEVEKSIKEWRSPHFDDLDVESNPTPDAPEIPKDSCLDPVEKAHYVLDLHHAAQAWRFALLVYIERVFKWRHGSASIMRLSLFARKALDSALSCRRSVMIQKQLLLPVFLAACETKDEMLREAARDYCNWWGSKTRYDMFLTTLGLLEEVWTAAESGDIDSWWGSVIDRKSGVGTIGPSYSPTSQYLFG